MNIDEQGFETAYNGFVSYVSEKDGRLFSSFNESKFLETTELDYKKRAFYAGQEVLKRTQWDRWLNTPGKIRDAVLAACQEDVSDNLLEHGHSYGPIHGPKARDYRPLLDLKGRPVSEMDAQLYDFLKPEKNEPQTLAARFNQFAKYLKSHRLGCTWRFLTYLVFLMDKEAYFPVLTTSFDEVMQFHGLDHKMTKKKVMWSSYQPLLDFAAELHMRLEERGHAPTSLIHVHTYIYLLGRHVLPKLSHYDNDTLPDFEALLAARKSRASSEAKRREETGLIGEFIVFKHEKDRLEKAGRPELASRVRHVAEEPVGYDVVSFRVNGEPLFIEVKTTRRSLEQPFWLTENECEVAKREQEAWTVIRVGLPEKGKPEIKKLGNVVISKDWHLAPDGFIAKRVGKT